MKIVKQIDPKLWKKETVCRVCYTTLEIEIADLRKYSNEEWQTFAAGYRYDCIVCKNQNNVDLAVVPHEYMWHVAWEKL